jgi:hypothetical protein
MIEEDVYKKKKESFLSGKIRTRAALVRNKKYCEKIKHSVLDGNPPSSPSFGKSPLENEDPTDASSSSKSIL